jgi:hypothetical protein
VDCAAVEGGLGPDCGVEEGVECQGELL